MNLETLAIALSAARLALASGDFAAAELLEREYIALEHAYSEQLGEELLAEHEPEWSSSAGGEGVLSWSKECVSSTVFLGSESLGSDRALNASTAAGEQQEIANSAPREPAAAGDPLLSVAAGERLFLWSAKAGPYPRSRPITSIETPRHIAELGLYAESV